MKNRRIIIVVGALALLSLRAENSVSAENQQTNFQTNPQTSLYTQSAAQTIKRTFKACGDEQDDTGKQNCSQIKDTSYLLLDARTGTLLASQWEHPEIPIPLGSLLKSFAALAYGQQHEFKYPHYFCRGTTSSCWLPRGHGELGIESAIADSCNAYFRMLTAQMRAQDIQPIAASFGLQPPDVEAIGANFAGLGGHWNISPLAMAHAYLELIRRRIQPGALEIVSGMALSASHGTGAKLGRALKFTNALAKTGTAPCTHSKHAPGDGFVVALVPAENPQILLMVRVHGVPGTQAAQVAGKILHQIEE